MKKTNNPKLIIEKMSWIFITLVFLYAIYILINRQINESYLEESHIYIAVEISKINFGKASTVHYFFVIDDKKMKSRKMCNLSELHKMNVGDIYLAKFNSAIEFSELICDCKLPNSKKSKTWNDFPGCN